MIRRGERPGAAQVGQQAPTRLNSQRRSKGTGHYHRGRLLLLFRVEHWGSYLAEAVNPSLFNISVPARYYEYFGKYHNGSFLRLPRQQLGSE